MVHVGSRFLLLLALMQASHGGTGPSSVTIADFALTHKGSDGPSSIISLAILTFEKVTASSFQWLRAAGESSP
jgi:hypothetical protein